MWLVREFIDIQSLAFDDDVTHLSLQNADPDSHSAHVQQSTASVNSNLNIVAIIIIIFE